MAKKKASKSQSNRPDKGELDFETSLAAVEQIVTGPPPQGTPLVFERFRRLKTAAPGAPI